MVQQFSGNAGEITFPGFAEQDILFENSVLALHTIVGREPSIEVLVVAGTPHLYSKGIKNGNLCTDIK